MTVHTTYNLQGVSWKWLSGAFIPFKGCIPCQCYMSMPFLFFSFDWFLHSLKWIPLFSDIVLILWVHKDGCLFMFFCQNCIFTGERLMKMLQDHWRNHFPIPLAYLKQMVQLFSYVGWPLEEVLPREQQHQQSHRKVFHYLKMSHNINTANYYIQEGQNLIYGV